ncbi:thioredoxin family protein [Pendulispora albinea]|uniref:Thioredoxin family protein n=1 Tax=Pendulispora albinea TaxID=2741071 RepID=A0ABZ2M9C1_9BACT
MRQLGFFGFTALSLGSLALLATSACAPAASGKPAAGQTTAASTTSSEGASGASKAARPLPFIEDDYGRALAEAKAKNKPLFVDGWAPWCHSCLSLKSYVLDTPQLRAEADKFVWLALDSEKEKNGAYFAKYGLDALPTIWVIDPQTEKVSWKLVGTVTAPELAKVLDDLADTKAHTTGDLDTAFAEASRIDVHKDAPGAVRALEKVLAAAPRGWARRPEALTSYVAALAWAKQPERCGEVALREGTALPMSSYRVTIASVGTGCVEEQPKGSVARGYLAPLLKELTDIVHLPGRPILADDRSAAFEMLVSALKADGKKDVAKQMASEWAAFLEGEAQRAPDAKGRAVFDAHRMLAYVELGDPARAIPMFTQSEHDFPEDYNPPARLGRTYFELKRYDEALDAMSRAIGKAYGARKLRLYQLKADIAAAKKDPDTERKTLDEALAFASTLSLREGYDRLRAQLAERRSKLGVGGTTAQR